MRKSKGKWTASYKDTFSLDMTLSPIIYAGLKRFHDVLEQRYKEDKCIGIPMPYCSNPEASLPDKEVQNWLDDIKKMMYAFENKEPDIRDYDFHMNMIPVEGGVARKGMSVPYTIESTNQAETDRYHEDCEEHGRLVQEGLNLLALRWKSLWW